MRQTSNRATTAVSPTPIPQELCKGATKAGIVRVPARAALAVDGAGAPEGQQFQEAVQALYSVAYTLKFALKREHRDFRVPPLEGRWWADPAPASFVLAPRETWRWQLRLGIPSGVAPKEVFAAVAAAAAKKPVAAKVRQIRIPAQTLGRILHVGPYQDEGRSLAAVRDALLGAGLAPAGPHVEVYLSDPRRVEPARLRTVLLLETEGAALSS